MARPKLYNTPEEKLAARRVTSKKYYDKNRVQICCRSRRAYKKKLKAVRKNPPCRVEPAIGTDPAESDVNSEAEVGLHALDKLARAREDFELLTCGDKYAYIDSLVSDYIKAPNLAQNACDSTLEMWEGLMKGVQDIIGDILQEYGCATEYHEADTFVAKEYREVYHLLGDIAEFLLTASPGDLADWHRSGALGYQIIVAGEKMTT